MLAALHTSATQCAGDIEACIVSSENILSLHAYADDLYILVLIFNAYIIILR